MKIHFPLLIFVAPFMLTPAPSVRSAAAPAKPATPYSSWVFQTDFSRGIPGWVSYPLAQDEGFDPTLYTTSGSAPALVRDVTAQGQNVLRIGLLRPLQFRAAPYSIFEIDYSLETGGHVLAANFKLAAADGRTYVASIQPGPGDHRFEISGARLGVPEAGATIQAIIIEADIQSPILGSRNRLTLHGLKVTAERTPILTLESPAIESSPVSGIAVARRVTTAASPLVLTLRHSEKGSASFFNGSGRLVQMETFQEKGAGLPQAEFRPRRGRDASGLWTAKVRSGAALTKLRFLVLGKIQPHPRVLLDGSRLRQLRSQASLVKLVAHEAVVLREGLA
ncbi:MAG: hypothetical protein KGM47_16185, partial [Acidobacteriota bacterium]|nr:hypothetical protein [Acidobacteriota bacterium]